MKNIFELLDAKRRQYAELGREIEALEIAARLLADGTPKRQVHSAEITQPDMIREILREAKRPLHVDQIATAIHRKYNRKLKSTYLTSIIFRQIKKQNLFYKSAPNTFGLIEWQINQSSPVVDLFKEKAAM